MVSVRVTDHALVRWLERHHGLDTEAFRQELADLAQPFADVKARNGKVGNLYLIMDGDRVVTVSPEAKSVRALKPAGVAVVPERLPWKALKRKRAHK
ncbi:hypothetical protein [Bosea lathyri]|uniref:Uncharacterized protein n=1 Tax=Bosea lathyri TaxID=1036778 RepID=A0A1H6BVI0_9HYPH|nr:hypothetical protein [Bosea lathyri]SEG64445.1 hypothetical protein SAMN04488115_10896 [Bosea lathyri]